MGKPASDDKKKAAAAAAAAMSLPKPQFQPQRRFSHAGFGMQGGSQPVSVEAKRKIILFHNMKFNPIMEEQNHDQPQKKEYGLNPNAPSFSMQQYPQQHNGRRNNGPNVRYIPMESQPMMMMQPVLVNPPRRFSAVSAGHAELAVSGLALPPNVIRMPRGPDKGKGFARWCNSRMKPSAPAAHHNQAPAPAKQQQQQPLPQRKSRAIQIVAPPEVAAAPAAAPEVEGAAAAAVVVAPAAAAPVAVNNNLVVNLDSSDSDEGHFSDHDLDDNERTR